MSEEEKAKDEYLELYKLAVEMADKVSGRRASLLILPLTANTALFAVLSSRAFDSVFALIALGGLVISLNWWLALESYRALNAAKFAVIAKMEKHLAVGIFEEEWRYMMEHTPRYVRGPWTRWVERGLPIVFVAIYAIALIAALVNSVL